MPTASVADTARVLSTVLAPIVAQGPILRRPRALKLAQRLEAHRRAAEAVRPEQVTWDDFTAMWWRIVRRVVLGDEARDDVELTAMLSLLRAEANWAYGRPKRTLSLRRFETRLNEHLARAEKGSLAELL